MKPSQAIVQPKAHLRAAIALSALVAVLVLSLGGAVSAAPTGSTDLKVTKTAGAGSVQAGSQLTYSISVENLGPEAATGVVVSDQLRASVDYVSATSTRGSCALQGRKVTCDLGAIEGGPTAKASTAQITLVVVPRKPGSLANTASVKADQSDPVASNNSSTVSVTVLAPPNPTQPPTCAGVAATIVGTGGPDTLFGTAGRDVIAALGGDDKVFALAGNDLVCAGAGNDFVAAGRGSDRVLGGSGRDRLAGRAGRDVLKGQSGADVLNGGGAPDRLFGGPGLDVCRRGPGDLVRSCGSAGMPR